jgi:hypothetical protein
MTGLDGTSFEALCGSCFRGPGHAEDKALTMVRRPTRYFFLDGTARQPRTGTLADRGVKLDLRRAWTLLRYEAHPGSHHRPRGAVRTHEQRLHPNKAAVTPDEQVRSHHGSGPYFVMDTAAGAG